MAGGASIPSRYGEFSAHWRASEETRCRGLGSLAARAISWSAVRMMAGILISASRRKILNDREPGFAVLQPIIRDDKIGLT